MPDFGDVIIVIPGILGSRLERADGTLVYDLTVKGLANTIWTLRGSDLSHLNRDNPPDDGVVATDLFNYQWLPGFFGNDDYDPLVAMLRENVIHSGQQVIKFPYDWRASNRWAAERLDQVARNALRAWQSSSGNADAKLWLVCHSMGGLVARYFCEHLGGATITRRLITIGTPHRGAARALEVLVNGMHLGGVLDLSGFVRGLPSVYELLPQYPVLHELKGGTSTASRLADIHELGARLAMPRNTPPVSVSALPPAQVADLLGLDRTMLERAVEFQAAIRNPVVRRMDEGAQAPYPIHCFLNRRQPTLLSAVLSRGRLESSESDPLDPPGATVDPMKRGDGTVAAFSAVPIEWADTSAAIAVPAKHVGMPASAPVIEQLRHWMRPQAVRAYMGNGTEHKDVLGLRVPSAIPQGEPLTIKVDAIRAANITVSWAPLAGSNLPLSIRVQVPGDGRPQTVEIGKLAPGSWQVTVTPEDRRRPSVSDYVLVVGDD